MQLKTYVIYHKADFDGIFCREIAHKFLPDAELIGWDYGDPEPIIAPENYLYILDLSVPSLMNHPSLIWIDHHKSAIDKYPVTIPGYRIDGVAACRLAWQWFTGNRDDKGNYVAMPGLINYRNREVPEPLAVRLAGEYDIWDKRDPDAELLQHGLRSEDVDFKTLLEWPDEQAGKYTVRLLNQGRAIQYAKTQENAGIITSYGFNVEWEGLVWLACNHARFNSQLFTAGVKPSHDALLGFNWTGQHWRVSLYHAPGKEHHDLSLIAVKHGGGGHRGACGFTADKLPWIP